MKSYPVGVNAQGTHYCMHRYVFKFQGPHGYNPKWCKAHREPPPCDSIRPFSPNPYAFSIPNTPQHTGKIDK